MKRTNIELAEHSVSDTLRRIVALIGITFVLTACAMEQPWRHLGPLYDKVMSQVIK